MTPDPQGKGWLSTSTGRECVFVGCALAVCLLAGLTWDHQVGLAVFMFTHGLLSIGIFVGLIRWAWKNG